MTATGFIIGPKISRGELAAGQEGQRPFPAAAPEAAQYV